MSAQEVNEPAIAPAPLLREGELLGGRYKIERHVGGGGMASIYRALHVGLDQPVAVKVVSPLIREVPGIVSRFMREARAATRLKGEHVVRVFDVGTTDDDAPFMVMELLEGKDLGEMLDHGFKPSVEEAIDFVLQACEALAEVHGLGIVHRDLKPANLFVTRGPDGLSCLKLIDFGISGVDSPLTPKDAVGLTSPEVVMGSPRYMPPEQMESAAAADSRSDIWGLGAILYEMLVGNAPFDGDSFFDIYAAAIRSPPAAPSSLRADLPEEIDEVLLKCLRVDPAERYTDVAELAIALAPLGDENAAVRAESTARVLDASRVRGGQGDADAAIVQGAFGKGSSSSRIRRRLPSSSRTTRRRRRATGLGAVAILLFGVGLAAGPVARKLDLTRKLELAPKVDLAPIVSVTGAAAATTAEPAPEKVPTPPIPETAAAAPARTATAPIWSNPAAARWTPSPPPRMSTAITAPEIATTRPEPKAELAPEPAPEPRVQVPRDDDRTLFEERK